MNINSEIKDTLLTIDIEIANIEDITAKASLIASKVKLLEMLVSNSGKKKLKTERKYDNRKQ